MDANESDVVCIGIVAHEQAVDWSPGCHQPDPVEWVSETTFRDILEGCAEAGVPLLPALDVYAQTRISAADCQRMHARWSALEAALKGTSAEAAAVAMGRLIELCADGTHGKELLIEGP